MKAASGGRQLYANMPELACQLGGRRGVLQEIAGSDALDQALKDIADFSDSVQGGASGLAGDIVDVRRSRSGIGLTGRPEGWRAGHFADNYSVLLRVGGEHRADDVGIGG